MIIALATGLPHESCGADELGEVLVGSDHVGLEAVGLGSFRQSADEVIGLEAVFFENGDLKGAAEAFDVRDGGGEFLGHVLALGFVFWEFLVAGGWGRGVEGDADMGRLLVFENGQEGVGETVERGGIDPF